MILPKIGQRFFFAWQLDASGVPEDGENPYVYGGACPFAPYEHAIWSEYSAERLMDVRDEALRGWVGNAQERPEANRVPPPPVDFRINGVSIEAHRGKRITYAQAAAMGTGSTTTHADFDL